MPLVSICCLAYNHHKYIRQCLDSILSQQRSFDIEIIINDDASVDGTAEIIKEYESLYPDIIRATYQIENQYSKGVNMLDLIFSYVKGKYVAICECDDYWIDPFKLQKQVEFLEANSDFSMCFHRASIVNETKTQICLACASVENREYHAYELFSQWLVPTASMMFRTEVTTMSLRCSRDVLNADIVLVLQCCRSGRVMAFDNEMSVYRMHDGGVTYSLQFAEERALKYPAHFLCIKKNFGDLIDRKVINRKISLSYWNLRELNNAWFRSQFNKLRAFYYDPQFIIAKYAHKL